MTNQNEKKIQERCLQVALNDYSSNYSELLQSSRSASMETQRSHAIAYEARIHMTLLSCSSFEISKKRTPRCITLREKCPYSEFFWSVFSRIWTEYGEILSFSPYSVQVQENTDQKNSEYVHVSCGIILHRFWNNVI